MGNNLFRGRSNVFENSSTLHNLPGAEIWSTMGLHLFSTSRPNRIVHGASLLNLQCWHLPSLVHTGLADGHSELLLHGLQCPRRRPREKRHTGRLPRQSLDDLHRGDVLPLLLRVDRASACNVTTATRNRSASTKGTLEYAMFLDYVFSVLNSFETGSRMNESQRELD